ncbi:MAG: hypothetical protein ACLP9L_31770 [Thermoguttaceae bacterium]
MRQMKMAFVPQPRRIMAPLVGLAGLGMAVLAVASDFDSVQKTCPLCKTTFSIWEQVSGTQFSMRSDLKPLGPIAAPGPIPVCPKCNFVLYSGDIPKEELDKCQRIVSGSTYKEHSKRASHYLLGILYEKLEKDDLTIGHIYLKASWQEETDPTQLNEDLKLSEKHFAAFLAKAGKHDGAWQTAQLIVGEIKRRLKDFDESKKHFDGLKKMAEFQRNQLEKIIDFQLRLIAKRDSEPHSLKDMDNTQQQPK